ncbi:MAG: GGDEF domain-containing protein [Amphritea sp.]|nr:GGDEF domain-containing protein [Amphritea sp.]
MNQDDWKEKYKRLAVDMDRMQAQLDDRSLQHLVAQMTVALEGRSDLLDRAMASLCQQLKQNDLGRQYKSALKVIEKELRSLDQVQERNSGELLQSLYKWVRQLRSQLNNDNGHNVLKGIEGRLDELRIKPVGLPSVINDMVALQGPLLNPGESSEPTSQPVQVDDSNDLSSADDEFLLQQIGAELLTLLSGLHIPKDEMPAARVLVRTIEKGIALHDLPQIIQSVIQLIAKVGTYSSVDFENYLLNLTEQLAEVQSFLIESQKDEQAGGSEVAQLSQEIHQDVQAIHHAVSSSKDLLQLKNEVSSQLMNIVKSVDVFKRNEEAREKVLMERYERMNDRLEQMEVESQQMKAHMDAEHLKALTDPLTSLPNRAGYDEQIQSEFERWKRYQQQFSIVVCDLDHFKRINDSFGHLAGDKVLRLIANILSRQSRATDFVARYGGEEFVILMPSTGAQEAAQAVEKIRQSIEKSPFNFHGKPVQITMSFGVAEITLDESLDALFERADRALYRAKGDGRNRIELG